MKAAFHFKVAPGKSVYGPDIIREIFSRLLKLRGHLVKSKVAIGDLLIWDALTPDNHSKVLNELLQLDQNTWKRFPTEHVHHLVDDIVFVICFDTITRDTAEALDGSLKKYSDYIGAYEINDANEYHWVWYGEKIGPRYRIENKVLYVLHASEEQMPEDSLVDLAGLGFEKIENEFTNLRYSVFDDNHNFEKARRLAEWKSQASDMLGTVIDAITGSLIDTAPDLGDKLWAMLNTYHTSETTEQLAQVMASCRRVFEYVVDCIFPAADAVTEGPSLKQDKYKNRLYQYASESAKSDTNINLIVANTDLLFKQWEKLYTLANKGVHRDTFRHETRRCLIRTILLLDDIVSLRDKPFPIQATLGQNFDNLINNIGDE
jgi:hypothetical protein